MYLMGRAKRYCEVMIDPASATILRLILGFVYISVQSVI